MTVERNVRFAALNMPSAVVDDAAELEGEDKARDDKPAESAPTPATGDAPAGVPAPVVPYATCWPKSRHIPRIYSYCVVKRHPQSCTCVPSTPY